MLYARAHTRTLESRSVCILLRRRMLRDKASTRTPDGAPLLKYQVCHAGKRARLHAHTPPSLPPYLPTALPLPYECLINARCSEMAWWIFHAVSRPLNAPSCEKCKTSKYKRLPGAALQQRRDVDVGIWKGGNLSWLLLHVKNKQKLNY